MKFNLNDEQKQEHVQTGFKVRTPLQVGCEVTYLPGTFFCYDDAGKIEKITSSEKEVIEWGNYNHCW